MRYLFLLSTFVLFLFSCDSNDGSITIIPEGEGNQEQPAEENTGNETPGEEMPGELPDGGEEGAASEFDDGTFRNLSAFDFTADMKTGWNIGNSLDAEGPDETFWGNPRITKAMIDAVAARGFKTLRIPVTWRFHQGPAPDYTVEEEWLDRVEEVVNYARANNMYAIVNVHHDDTWIIPTAERTAEVSDRLAKLWTQIANRFRKYSDYVIFETLNEPRHEDTPNEWNGGTAEGRAAVNAYHQAGLDAIRATGGNNLLRQIMISTYAASTLPVAMDGLIIPNDDPRTLISLHSYFPFPFTLEGTDQTWGTTDDKTQLTMEMNRIKAKFTDNGKAVVLGEWSSGNQDNIEDRLEHAAFYAEAAAERGFASVWWDNGNSGISNDGLGIFDRNNLTWPFGNIADAIIAPNN